MTPEQELEMVQKAIQMGRTVTGCCEWHEDALLRVLHDQDLRAHSPQKIRQLMFDFVLKGGTIKQIVEKRPEYCEFDFYYKVIVPAPGFPNGLFIELRLYDPDADCPTVLLVNAHPQRN